MYEYLLLILILLLLLLLLLKLISLKKSNVQYFSQNVNPKKKIPIIIFHNGNQDYVKICINQALKFNNEIILINDNPNNYKNITSPHFKCINSKNYSKNADKFKKYYKHFSNNNYNNELICIARWLYVEEYMRKHNIYRAFVCDSDILIYDDIDKINSKYLYKYDFMLCSAKTNLTGGQSIWDLHKIIEFKSFIFNFYNKKNIQNIKKWWKTYTKPGGICDMTLLYYFANKTTIFEGLIINNVRYFDKDLTNIFDNSITFDLHISNNVNQKYKNDYEMKNGIKNIQIKKNKAYVFNKRLNKDIRFILLHFQGNKKHLMNKYKSK